MPGGTGERLLGGCDAAHAAQRVGLDERRAGGGRLAVDAVGGGRRGGEAALRAQAIGAVDARGVVVGERQVGGPDEAGDGDGRDR